MFRFLTMFHITALIILFGSLESEGHPVPFKNAIAIDSLNQSYKSDHSVAYSFERNFAISARIMKFDNQGVHSSYYASQLNYLVQRWNGEGFQANTYLGVGVGPMIYNGHEHSAILTAFDADAETRQLYISGKVEKMWNGAGYEFWHLRSRLGVALYTAGFDQVASWIMIEYEYNPIFETGSKVTPLLRIYYDNYLVEAGVSTVGEWMLNFMIHI